MNFARSAPVVRATFERVLAVVGAFGPVEILPEKTRIALHARMSFAAFVPARLARRAPRPGQRDSEPALYQDRRLFAAKRGAPVQAEAHPRMSMSSSRHGWLRPTRSGSSSTCAAEAGRISGGGSTASTKARPPPPPASADPVRRCALTASAAQPQRRQMCTRPRSPRPPGGPAVQTACRPAPLDCRGERA